MAEFRKRQFVKRTVLAVVVCVLLLSGYVSSYLALWWLRINGSISTPSVHGLNRTIYAPIVLYVDSGYPGSDLVVSWRKEISFQIEKRAMEAEQANFLRLLRESKSKR